MSRFQLLKINQFLLFLVLLTIVFYYGKGILIPVVFAIMLSMLMAPLCRWLDKKGFPRALSCLVCILILLLVFLGMIAILMAQLSGFIQDLPLFEQKTNDLLISLQKGVEQRFEIPVDQQTHFIKTETKNISVFLRTYFTGMLQNSLQLIVGLAITIAFTFLMLFHKERYYTFFLKFSAGATPKQKEEVLDNIALVAQQYLKGRAISIIILFVLYVLTLFIAGIKGALLLAAVAALVNIIPYVGPILAAVIPVFVALVTEPSLQPAIWVLVCFCIIQAIDNYFVTPFFLGGEVSLSALSTIVAIICGGYLWGISGMILFIPMLSIVGIIFKNVPSLHHYALLIGDKSGSPSAKITNWIKKVLRFK